MFSDNYGFPSRISLFNVEHIGPHFKGLRVVRVLRNAHQQGM